MHQHFFWANLQEIGLLSVPMLKNIRRFTAACFSNVLLKQTFQLRDPMWHCYWASDQCFVVDQCRCFTVRIVQVSHAASHTSTKVCTNRSDDNCNAASGVFATV